MDLLNLGLNPIVGDNPAGQDIRSSEIYEELSNEIDKRTMLSGSGVVNWQKVVELSSKIIADYSKDILVCSYLSVGLLHTKGLKGLAESVTIYRDILFTFWNNGLYPPRPNGRINAISWWADNIHEQLDRQTTENWQPEEKSALENAFSEIVNFLEENGLSELEQIYSLSRTCMSLIVDRIQSSTNENMASSNNVVPSDKPKLASIASVPSFGSGVGSDIIDNDIDKSLSNVLSLLSKINGMISQDQPLSYKIFKINRFVAWLDINVLPPCDNEQKTMLPPPDEYLNQSLKSLYNQKNWLELIKVAEPRVTDLLFWLDLSFYVYTALRGLGQTASANEISYATLAFTKRLDGVERLLFSDGTPFANNDTQDWINNLANNSNGASLSSSYSAIDLGNELEVELAEANNIKEHSDALDAVDFLHNKIKETTNLQSKFLKILQFCQFCINSGHGQLTSGYVNEILLMINKYKLEDWNSSITSEAYKLVLNLVRGNKKLIELDDSTISNILMKLSLIDPVSAAKYYK